MIYPDHKKGNGTHLIAEIAGWYGAAAVITAYSLVTFEVINANGYVFQLLNLTGALGIMTLAVFKHVSQSVVINIFWAAIAIFALIKLSNQ